MEPVTFDVRVGGISHKLTLTRAEHHESGEFAGNIDVVLGSSPMVAPAAVAAELRLRVPGQTDWLDTLGSGLEGRLIGLTYHDPKLEGVPAPSGVELGTRGSHDVLARFPLKSATTG